VVRIQARGFPDVTYEDVLLALDEVTRAIEAAGERLSPVCIFELPDIEEEWPDF
jgi:2-keto-4-pentenoate hydratase